MVCTLEIVVAYFQVVLVFYEKWNVDLSATYFLNEDLAGSTSIKHNDTMYATQ